MESLRSEVNGLSSERIIEVVHGLAQENRPGSAQGRIYLQTRLIEDLGLDSMSRMELIRRIEALGQTAFDERRVFEAKTVSALIEAVRADQNSTQSSLSAAMSRTHARRVVFPESAATIVDALQFHVELQPQSAHLRLLLSGSPQEVSYQEFFTLSLRAAGALREMGVAPGDRLGLMLPTSLELLLLYFGALLAGAVPVPLYPPASMDRLEEHLRRQVLILQNAGVAVLVVPQEARLVASLLSAKVPTLRSIVSPQQLTMGREIAVLHRGNGHDLAFLQYTSGSTGQPKGVMLTHRNILENIRAMTEVLQLSADDVCVSWLPLYHDMGLIGAWLGSLLTGVPLVLMSPLSFLAKPVRWLRAISESRGTISAGPNFAYELCADRVRDDEMQGLDLSSWRVALNGAEPVNPQTIERFSARFLSVGFRREAMRPVYGLAESALGVLFPRRPEPPRIASVKRAELQVDRRAIETSSSQASVQLVSSGSPLPRHEVRLVDELGREVAEGYVGMLEFKGPSATAGYYENPEATASLLRGEWRISGDFGVRLGDDYFIVGRQKDLIIRAGRNIAPQDVEEAASSVRGVRRGCVAAFALGAGTGAEQLVIVAETRMQDAAERAEIERGIVDAVTRAVEVAPDRVLLVPPRTVPKTSSGKIRRSDCRARFEMGTLLRRQGWWSQAVRMALPSILHVGKSLPQKALALTYGLWCWGCFLFLGASAVPLVALSFSPAASRSALRFLARCVLFITRMPVSVGGIEYLPTSACIIASNHQSYVDAVLLTAVLPARFQFVAKRDFKNAAFFKWFFGRIGAFSIERNQIGKSAEDLAEVTDALRRGSSLVFFPEGGFWRDKTALLFKTGAFQAAAEAGVAVVPVALRGTREVLIDGSWLPRRARISVWIGEPKVAKGTSWKEVASLRNIVEQEVRAHA